MATMPPIRSLYALPPCALLPAALFALAACATTPETGAAAPAAQAQENAPVPVSVPDPAPPPQPVPPAPAKTEAEFIGQSPSRLEAVLGEPAFVRREGVGEFRRYDTPDCRIYAVVTVEDGGPSLIRSLSVGAASAARAAPDLAECLSGA